MHLILLLINKKPLYQTYTQYIKIRNVTFYIPDLTNGLFTKTFLYSYISFCIRYRTKVSPPRTTVHCCKMRYPRLLKKGTAVIEESV